MGIDNNNMLPIINKSYAVTYKNEYDQVDVLEGLLAHPDLNGFTVFSVGGKRVMIPKDRIFILRESTTPSTEKPLQGNQTTAGANPGVEGTENAKPT